MSYMKVGVRKLFNLQNLKGNTIVIGGRNLIDTETTFIPLSENQRLIQSIAYERAYKKVSNLYEKKREALRAEYPKKLTDIQYAELKHKRKLLDIERQKEFDKLGEMKKNCEIEVENYFSQEELEELKKFLPMIESLYASAYSSKKPVEMLEVSDGKVVLPADQKYHASNQIHSMEQMESFSKIGIVASEWFGEPESQREARFCAFLRDDTVASGLGDGNSGSIRFYVDTKGELGQKLASYDYFEYEHIKRNNPEQLNKLFKPEAIEMFEFISSCSGCGKTFHDDPNSYTYSWMAIPGGIPPQLIVGIRIDGRIKELRTPEALKKISEIFPNAVLFDEDENVLEYAKNELKGKKYFE
ncbi:MAG: hypothetical protein IJ542_00590 [Clostridia bacterium]|nr:hypothetical protein [Clostridia bacterium]